MPSTTRISRQRKELLAQYATAAVCLYGVLSTSEFADVFNHYEEAHTTEEEALLALTRLAKTDDVEYSICANIISGPEFQPEFDDYEEVVEDIRQHQKGKPRYLPSKEEFLKYTNFSYYEPEKPYADLRAHILKNQLTTRGTGVRGVDGDLLDLRELILLGATVTDEIDYFSEHGYKFKGKDDVSEFAQLLMEVHNNTIIYVNNGFTPMELFEQYERPKLKPLPKIGRNEPCPCGSGLKYKRCCGKAQ